MNRKLRNSGLYLEPSGSPSVMITAVNGATNGLAAVNSDAVRKLAQAILFVTPFRRLPLLIKKDTLQGISTRFFEICKKNSTGYYDFEEKARKLIFRAHVLPETFL